MPFIYFSRNIVYYFNFALSSEARPKSNILVSDNCLQVNHMYCVFMVVFVFIFDWIQSELQLASFAGTCT